ncbi:MAG: 3-phosphoglycerate dehydrogenase [Clostridia bacterium]|nr:3-phosphoglycerate dehydrogenase [Clostridia bacterium]
MYRINTLNKISATGLAVLPEGFEVGEFAEPDALLVRSAQVDAAALPASVLAIGRAGAGVNNIPVPECTSKGIAVFNTPGANANAVKELAVCALLLASRRIVAGAGWCRTLASEGDNFAKAVEKGKSQFAGPEIAGKTLGVVGLGAIGVLVANAAAGLGMEIVGYDPFLSEKNRAALCSGAKLVDDINELFAASDYITLHCPLLDSTKNTVCAESLAKCRDGVRIVNLARGGLVDTGALIGAVKTGKCAAYVTDFAAVEMLGVDGITVLPHLGASTPESEENCAVMAAEEISGYLLYGSVVNSVNLPALELGRPENRRLTAISTSDVSALGEKLGAVKTASASRGGVFYTAFELDTAEGALEAAEGFPGVVKARLI